MDAPRINGKSPPNPPPPGSLPSSASSWKEALSRAIRDPEELLKTLELAPELLPGALEASRLFPLLAPRDYVSRMEPGNPNDPLLRQVLPLDIEKDEVGGYVLDPLEEADSTPIPGLLQKYEGRALLLAASTCAVHCRYCFRRHFPYEEVPKSQDAWEPALDLISRDTTLHEIILSGGDPLLLPDPAFFRLLEKLDPIPHLRRLRIHSRLPIVLPQRITPELLERLTSLRLTAILVIHSNHARELEGNCADALRRCVEAGIPVLNQAVLLRGVNDEIGPLAELCERCVDLGVIPYYLHQLDPVAGAAHFKVEVDRGRELIEQLRSRLPGYAVPTFVQEVPGAKAKVPL